LTPLAGVRYYGPFRRCRRGTGVGIAHSPPSAQSTAHQAFRRLFGRIIAGEGILLFDDTIEQWWWKRRFRGRIK